MVVLRGEGEMIQARYILDGCGWQRMKDEHKWRWRKLVQYATTRSRERQMREKSKETRKRTSLGPMEFKSGTPAPSDSLESLPLTLLLEVLDERGSRLKVVGESGVFDDSSRRSSCGERGYLGKVEARGLRVGVEVVS
ncbi:hypothetical protein Fmac_018783 [Flemingia macrophylla]|uniref:Uncharacterized protein n=1 Tax=Flemingia macrophylla TaxID=520843 RepID=A0ABD1M6B8_9FABA